MPAPVTSRRAFLSLLALGAAAPRGAHAQPSGRVPRIGYLADAAVPDALDTALVDALGDVAVRDGRRARLEIRYAAGSEERFPGLAADLVRIGVDVIVAREALAAVAARKATAKTPIVFVAVSHPVELGLVARLARPGANVTGVGTARLAERRLRLLRELVLSATRIALLIDPAAPTVRAALEEAKAAGRALDVSVEPFPLRNPADVDGVFASMSEWHASGLLVSADALLRAHRARVVSAAAAKYLPAIYPSRDFLDAGGLMSYAPHPLDLAREAVKYVEQILRGAAPAELPVGEPTRFALVINAKTARVLGVGIPPWLLLQADQIID
jgi:putative ABC transport system substrate-binding protein